MERHNSDLIWTRRSGSNYGDWLQVDAKTPREVLATAYFAQSATFVARAARVLGDDEAAAYYSELADRIVARFQSEFVEADGRVAGDTQTAYALAAEFGLLPLSRHGQLESHLTRKIEEHGGRLTTGFVGVSLLLPALSDLGRDDLAYALLHEDGYPSWLYSVDHGATTMWERWDGWTVERGFQAAVMNSFNHYAFGAVGEWLYRYAAGIDQTDDSVAFRHLKIAPRVGGQLEFVRASYETARGKVVSEWQRQGRDFHLALTVPPGAKAVVTVPSADGSVTEGGRPIADCDQVSDVSFESSAVRFETESGTFQFRTVLPEGLILSAN